MNLPRRIVWFAAAPLAGLALAGCVASSTGSPGVVAASPMAAPPAASPIGPATCAGPIAQYQAVIDADHQTGNVNPSVYRRIVADLESVKAGCAAGRAGEANQRLAAVKGRYGYR